MLHNSAYFLTFSRCGISTADMTQHIQSLIATTSYTIRYLLVVREPHQDPTQPLASTDPPSAISPTPTEPYHLHIVLHLSHPAAIFQPDNPTSPIFLFKPDFFDTQNYHPNVKYAKLAYARTYCLKTRPKPPLFRSEPKLYEQFLYELLQQGLQTYELYSNSYLPFHQYTRYLRCLHSLPQRYSPRHVTVESSDLATFIEKLKTDTLGHLCYVKSFTTLYWDGYYDQPVLYLLTPYSESLAPQQRHFFYILTRSSTPPLLLPTKSGYTRPRWHILRIIYHP